MQFAAEEELAEAALKHDRATFVRDIAPWFLIVPVADGDPPSMRFRTAVSDYVKRFLEGVHEDETEPPSLKSPRWNRTPWAPRALAKRSASPFTGRISIGRAPNVDVVLRSPFVSKLHAHVVLREAEPPTITDLGSQNGTAVNGVRLKPNQPEATANGDIVSFGEAHCEMATAEVLYYALRRKYLFALRALHKDRVG